MAVRLKADTTYDVVVSGFSRTIAAMARRRHAVRLGIPAVIVAALALVALWRIAPPREPLRPVATSGDSTRAAIERIPIREVTSATTFWAGRIDEPPVFVVVAAGATRGSNVRLTAGQEVSLVGVVHPVPAEADMRRRWGVDELTAKSVREVGTYIEATQVN